MTEDEYKDMKVFAKQEVRDQRVQAIYMAREIINDNRIVVLAGKYEDTIFSLAERIEAWVNR